MNDLYIHQLETENKQLRTALHTTRKVLEEQQQRIDKAIEEIKCEIERYDGSNEDFISASWVEMKTDDYIAKLKNILEILEDNTITLNTKDMNISFRGKDE